MQYFLYILLTILNFLQALSIPYLKGNDLFISYSIFYVSIGILLPIMSYSISNIFQKRYAFADDKEEKQEIYNKCKKISFLSSLIFFIPSIYLINFIFSDKFQVIDLLLILLTAILSVNVELGAAKFRVDKDQFKLEGLFKRRIFYEHILRFPTIVLFCDSQTTLFQIILLSHIPTALTYIDRDYFLSKITYSDSLLTKNFVMFIASLFGVFITFFDKIILLDVLDPLMLATLFICTRFSNAITVFFTKTYSLYLQGNVYADVKNLSQADNRSYFRQLYIENLKYGAVSSFVIFLISFFSLYALNFLSIYDVSPTYPFILASTCVSAFIFSLNFTASYQLTSKELFEEYALINVVSVGFSAAAAHYLLKYPLDLPLIIILVVSPAYINYMLINTWVSFKIDRYYLRFVVVINILLSVAAITILNYE